MHKKEIKLQSNILNTQKNIVILEPNIIDSKTKIFFLLHGLGGNEKDFYQKTDITKLVDKYNIIAICPEANNSWYVKDYYSYINEELYDFVKKQYNLDVIISGFSMGGYGAMYLGLTNDKYLAIGSISGSIDIVTRDKEKRNDINIKESWEAIFGDVLDEKYNLFNYLTNEKYMYITVGYNDHLLNSNRNFKKHIMHNNYTYIEREGVHSWDYVKTEIEPMICELINHVNRNSKIL